jgi:hypothetical protein
MATQTPVDIYETYFHKRCQPAAINEAASALRSFVLDSADPQACQSNSQWDLLEFCKRQPRGVDFALQVYHKAFKNIEEVRLEPDSGLESLVGNHAKLFQGGSGPADVGKELSWESYDESTGDACNLIFTKAELEDKTVKVIERITEFQVCRLEIILLQAIRGRSHSLDIIRDNNTISWIDFSLDPFHAPSPPWSKADFIAICVLLRACAKSLLDTLPSTGERQAKLDFWKAKFSAFIYSETPTSQSGPLNRDGDFVIKWHAMVIMPKTSP